MWILPYEPSTYAYAQAFVEQYSAAPGSKDKYIKYTPAELRAAVQNDLFEMREDARAQHAAASFKRLASSIK